MKRFQTTKHYNNMYLLPTLYLKYEKDLFMYINIVWFKRGIQYRVYNKSIK
jgi:hypothetical protein